MTEKFGYDSFLSPFTWRYGSPEMRNVFSEINYRAKWREVWQALAKAEYDYGLLSRAEFNDIRKHASLGNIDIGRSQRIEKEIKHDVMAEIRTFASQAKIGGGKIHLGATSADIEDNADMLRTRDAIGIILTRIVSILSIFEAKIRKYQSIPCMGWTHLQPAEPTTLGYRFAGYAQDLLIDMQTMEFLLERVALGKGMKGAVGTSASYSRLVGKHKAQDLEKKVLEQLKLEAHPISTQTYPRKVDLLILSALASIAQSVQKFAIDLRILQSPPFGEVSEPFNEKQVGSSAMPFKRNPMMAERATSLARYVSSMPSIGMMNASNTMLERTLDDSANRRIAIPEAFLALDECLILYGRILSGMKISSHNVRRNLEKYGVFSLMEPIMMDLVKSGEDRQVVHEKFRVIASKAWTAVEKGDENPLGRMLLDDETLKKIYGKKLEKMLDPGVYVGDAPLRTEKFLKKSISPILKKNKKLILKPRAPKY